jgi:hypothetical protein
MKEWLLNLIVEFILKAISDDKIQDLASQIKSVMIPFLREQKDALISRLMQKAAATNTPIDDAVYHALDVFLDSFIPKESDAECFAKNAVAKTGNENYA